MLNYRLITERGPLPLLLGITAIGAVLRCYPIHESLWIDELHTAWVVSGEGHDLTRRAHLGNNGSAYFILVKAITDRWGLHEWTLRLVSLISGCALIPATYWLARHWKCSVPASLLAAALVAVDRNDLYFSGEARTYALVQLVAVGHLVLYSLLITAHRQVWTWSFWIVTGILLFHLHCTTALVFAAEAVGFAVLVGMRRIQSHPLYLLIGAVVVGIGMLPAMPLLVQIAERRDNWALFVGKQSPTAMLSIFPLYLYVLIPIVSSLIVLGVNRLRVRSIDEDDVLERSAHFVPLVIAGTWILLPIITAWLLTEADIARLFYRRYLIASSVALAPVSAILISHVTIRRHARWVVLATLVVAVVCISPARHFRYGALALAHSSEDWRSPVTAINDAPQEIPVILYSGLIEADAWHDADDADKRAYCELPVRGIYRINETQAVIALPKTKPIVMREGQRELVAANGAWLLIRGDTETAERVQSEVIECLGDGWTVSRELEYGRVHLLGLKKGDGSRFMGNAKAGRDREGLK